MNIDKVVKIGYYRLFLKNLGTPFFTEFKWFCG